MRGGDFTKKILLGLLIVGAIYVAASSPYFAFYLSRDLKKILGRKKPLKKDDPRFKNAFYYLKRKGYLNIEQKGHKVHIGLTEKGRKRAGKYLIDDLRIEKPKKWDGTYRIVIFDIPNITNLKRNAFRGKLKELGFYCLQRSVWVYPYECGKEITILREFFGLTKKELRLIIGEVETDAPLRKFFKL